MEKPLKIAELRRRLRVLEGLGESLGGRGDRAAAGFGVAAIDGALPGGGLASGCLHEVTGSGRDGAAGGFAAALLGRIAHGDAPLLWCRVATAGNPGAPYPPGLERFGIAAARVVFVEARRGEDALWAMEEGLRASGVAAVYGEGVALDLTTSRRLQLAAESTGKTALALVPSRRAPPVTAATTRWRVTALPSLPCDGAPRPRWHVELIRCRGGNPNRWIVEWNDAALHFDLAASLADGLLATSTA
ncbi:MAG: ImuA family protein [Gemmatimonas sp.]